jgi:DNA-binding response OmpR family regulator
VSNSDSIRNEVVSTLLVGDFGDDRRVVRDVFQKPGWQLLEAGSRRDAMRSLEGNCVHVVMAGTDLPDWPWKRALADLRKLPKAPQLVVASRAADDQLWSEVLNLGAYDLLAQPLRPEEVERVLVSAWRHCGFAPQRAVAATAVRAQRMVA